MKKYNNSTNDASFFQLFCLVTGLIGAVTFITIPILGYSTQKCFAHHTFTAYKRCPDCKVIRGHRGSKHIECNQQLRKDNNSYHCIYPVACKILLILNYTQLFIAGLIGFVLLVLYIRKYLFRN